MAKDDYYVIVAKVLVYLYKKVKGREPVESDYLKPQTDNFLVTEEYFLYVLEMMERQGFFAEF